MMDLGVVYPYDNPFSIPFPKEMLKVAQDQLSNNQDERLARHRELLCPFLGNPNSHNDLIVISVENPLVTDDELTNVLCLEVPELMQIWEARPISLFNCLQPSCRTPIPVRNRAHLLQLLRLDRYFGLRVGAGDLVEFKALCEMLCGSCGQELQHGYEEALRADRLAQQARTSQLRKMPFSEYRLTPEWRSRRNGVLLRAGNKCELCYASGRLEAHHRTYERYAEELLSDLIALCRSCHQRFHDTEPEAA
jgi:hypothetical protein